MPRFRSIPALLLEKRFNAIIEIKTIALIACALMLNACDKKQSSVKNNSVAPSKQVAVLADANAQPLDGQVDSFMTDQLHIFIQQNGRLPRDIVELIHSRMDSAPKPPDGMKWTIDRATQEVRLVK